MSDKSENTMAAFEKELTAFLKDPFVSRQWLHLGDLVEVYCRKAVHVVDGEQVETLDIANINANPPGHGLGSGLIDFIHHRNPYPVTYIENVLSFRFYSFLIRKGWKDCHPNQPNKPTDRCVFKHTFKGLLIERLKT